MKGTEMKLIYQAAVAAGLLSLAACNNTPAEQAADNIEDNAEAVADNITDNAEAVAENITDNAEAVADNVTDAADNKADAVESNGM
jgi:cell division septum initiation protein DivIVA